MLDHVSFQVVHRSFLQSETFVFSDQVFVKAELLKQIVVGHKLLLLKVDIDSFPVLAFSFHHLYMLNCDSNSGPIDVKVFGFVVASILFLLECLFDALALLLDQLTAFD